jgi:Flp pilus assembly protein TadG
MAAQKTNGTMFGDRGAGGRLGRDERGMAAVEFAILLPLMVLIYFGSIELTQGFSADRKATLLARDLADLASQGSTLNSSSGDSSDVNMIFAAAAGVMYPFSGPQMTLTGVVFKTGSDGKVHAYTDWSVQSGGGTLRACGELKRTSVAGTAPPAVPDGLFVAGTTLVIADVSYVYLPMIGKTFLAIGSNGANIGSGTLTSITLRHSAYMQPRTVARVTYTAETDPGVISVRNIYAYYKAHGIKTVVMGASFRNVGEIEALAGCDRLTISPQLLEALAKDEGPLPRRLDPASAGRNAPARMALDESAFRFRMNEDPMATEKLAEGIRQFAKDLGALRELVALRLNRAA